MRVSGGLRIGLKLHEHVTKSLQPLFKTLGLLPLHYAGHAQFDNRVAARDQLPGPRPDGFETFFRERLVL